MKKQKVIIIFAIAILLLGIGSFGIIKYFTNKSGDTDGNTELFNCVPSAIARYTVCDGNNSYTLVKASGKWSVENNEVAVLDQQAVRKIVNSASMISAQGILGEEELKSFKATDVQTLEIKLENGISCRISFVGQKDQSCAVKVNDREEIYLLHKSVRDILLADLDKLRVSLVFEELLNSDEVLKEYSFVGYDDEKTVIRTKTASEIAQNKNNRFIMEIPYKRDVDDEKLEQQIAVRIPSVAAAKYVDDFPENLADYGLDEESRAVLTFKWGNIEEVLYLGTEEGGQVHAVKKGKDGVFVIDAAQLEFLHTDPFFLLDTKLFLSETEDIVSVAATFDNQRINASRSADSRKFFVNGNAASELAFDSVTEKLEELELLDEIAEQPKNSGDAVVEVVFDNGAPKRTISLSRINEKEYAVFENGTAAFTVGAKAVDEFMEELKGVANNPMKTDEKG